MHETVVSTYCHNPIHAGTCSDVFDGRFERGGVGASWCVLEHLAQEQPVLPMVMGVGIHAEWMGECMMVAALMLNKVHRLVRLCWVCEGSPA